MLEGLSKAGVKCRPLIDTTRPTTNKNAIIAGGYRLLKVDTLDNRSISDAIVLELAKAIATENVRRAGVQRLPPRHLQPPHHSDADRGDPGGRLQVADSQVASRWGNITDFRGFDLITPNEREARFALGDQDSGVRPLAASLYRRRANARR